MSATLGMYSIFDEKADAYLPPFMLPNDPMAVRTFCDCVADQTHAFGRNPADYTLFRLGTFDTTGADIHLQRTTIITGLEARAMLIQPTETAQ